MYRFCLARLRNREDAEDARQTTFVRAIRALDRGVAPEDEVAWLLTIARNVCLSANEAGKRRRTLELVREPGSLEQIGPAADRGDLADVCVRKALGRLPDQQRRAIVMREWHGLSYDEIARELRVTRGATEALIFRARRSLADALAAQGHDRRLRPRHAFDLGSLVTAVKAAFAGGLAAKAVALVTVAVVATTAVVAKAAISERRDRPAATAERGGAAEAPRLPGLAAPWLAPSAQTGHWSSQPADGLGRASRRGALGAAVATGEHGRPAGEQSAAGAAADGPGGAAAEANGLDANASAGAPSAGAPSGGAPTAAASPTEAAPASSTNDPLADPATTVTDAVDDASSTVTDTVNGASDTLADAVGDASSTVKDAVRDVPLPTGGVDVPKAPSVDVPKVEVPQAPSVPQAPATPEPPSLPSAPAVPEAPSLP